MSRKDLGFLPQVIKHKKDTNIKDFNTIGTMRRHG